MGWKSVLFGFATVVALCLGSLAQGATALPAPLVAAAAQKPADARQITPYQLPVRDTSATPAQPRYATMVAPAPEADVSVTAPQPASPPVAAPTTPVAAAPIDQALPGVPVAEPSRALEQVTVTGLRALQEGFYRLGPGDKLRVTVFNEGDLSGEFVVDGQGFVRLPLIGQLQAAGLTTFALESRIADRFTGGGFLVSPRVSIEIIGYRPFYIIGEIAKPGEYAYVSAMSAQNAVALAGGYTDRAVESAIWVRHQGEAKEHEYPADETTRILPGDVVRVSRSTYWTIMTLLAPIISPFSSIAYLVK